MASSDLFPKPDVGSTVNYAHSISSGLLNSWLLNEGSGTAISDSASSGDTGTIVDMPWSAGPNYYVISNSDNDRISLTLTGPNSLTTAGTMLIWFSTTQDSPYRGVYCLNDASTSNYNFEFQNNSTSTRVNVGFGGSVTSLFDGSYTLNDGVIHQIVVTRNGATVNLYVDGAYDDTASVAATSWGGNFTYAYLANWGTGAYSCIGNYYLAQLWNRALSGTEISSLYANPYSMYAPSPSVTKKLMTYTIID